MSKPKDISKKHLDEWNGTTGFVEPNTGYYFEIISVMESAMQEHTTQTLDRLKDEVYPIIKTQQKLIEEYGNEMYKCDQIEADEILSQINRLQEDVLKIIEDYE